MLKRSFISIISCIIYHVPGICSLCLTTVGTATTLTTYINDLPQNLSLSLPKWKIMSLKNLLLKILNGLCPVLMPSFLKFSDLTLENFGNGDVIMEQI